MGSSMTARRMSRGFLAAIALLAATGCAQRTPPLYMWESFARHQYDTLNRDGGKLEEQVQKMDAHAEKARAANAALPPGFRAHLGMLQLNLGNTDKARDLWMAEKSAFPESAPYMDQLLKRLTPAATTTKTDAPA